MSLRKIASVFKGQPTIEGAGVHLKRAFGYHQVPMLDPFLMLDDFHTSRPEEYVAGFPWHPHRGIETVTYVIEGIVEHGDSMGNSGAIGAGDVQWMTAGSGIIHQEMPRISPTGTMWGIQLWLNLPAANKMMDPRYRDVNFSQIPDVNAEPGILVKVIAGEFGGVVGPVQEIVTNPTVLDVQMAAGCCYQYDVLDGQTVIVHMLDGEADFGVSDDMLSELHVQAEHIDAGSAVLYERSGDTIRIITTDHKARFMLLMGHPINETVAWRGPIVMNTKEELQLAFDELRDGHFVKISP